MADILTLGHTVDNLTQEVCFAYGLPEGTKGVLIAETEGLEQTAGVTGGDLIVKVNGYPVYDLVSLFKVFKKMQSTQRRESRVIKEGEDYKYHGKRFCTQPESWGIEIVDRNAQVVLKNQSH